MSPSRLLIHAPAALTVVISCLTCSDAWSAETTKPASQRQGRERSPAVVNPVMRSPLQSVLSLNGDWDFCTDPKVEGEACGWQLPGKPLPSAQKLHVPACWEAQGIGAPGLSSADNKHVYEPINVRLRATYTGAAWYKKDFVIPSDWSGKRVLLKIGGVNAQGWIWVNGAFVAHDWTYCGTWKYDVTDLVSPGKKATIAVLARNDVPSRRGESNCVRAFGGLFRSVEVAAAPSVSIDYVYAEPLFDRKTVRLHVTIRNAGATAGNPSSTLTARIVTLADQHEAGKASSSVSVAPGKASELTLDVGLDPFRPWSPESPSLYKAELTLTENGRAADGWIERFGMKKFEGSRRRVRLEQRTLFSSRLRRRLRLSNHGMLPGLA